MMSSPHYVCCNNWVYIWRVGNNAFVIHFPTREWNRLTIRVRPFSIWRPFTISAYKSQIIIVHAKIMYLQILFFSIVQLSILNSRSTKNGAISHMIRLLKIPLHTSRALLRSSRFTGLLLLSKTWRRLYSSCQSFYQVSSLHVKYTLRSSNGPYVQNSHVCRVQYSISALIYSLRNGVWGHCVSNNVCVRRQVCFLKGVLLSTSVVIVLGTCF